MSALTYIKHFVMINDSRFYGSFAVLMVIISLISIEMSLHFGAELLLILVATIPIAVIAISNFKNVRRNDSS